MAGTVEVDGRRVDKPGTAVGATAVLGVVGPREPFVSRAGRKLAGALDDFGLDPAGKIVLDIGASTGGFTDCLLKRGAARVYAIDVGFGQLDARLRADSRVVVLERTNARHLEPKDLPEAGDFAVIDVSFISLAKVVPALLPLLAAGSPIVALIKPQFEAGRGAVGKGGILRDETVRSRAIERTLHGLAALGLSVRGSCDSQVAGVGGNREAFAWLQTPQTPQTSQAPLEFQVTQAASAQEGER